MKVINDNVAYVQKIDIGNISTYDMPMPSSIFLMAIGENYNLNDKLGSEFVKFTDPNDVDFFKNVEWILDYNEVINIDEEDIVLLIQELILKREKMVNGYDFNSIESIKNLNLAKECNKIDLLIESLNYVLKVKKKTVNFEMPDNVETSNKKDGLKVLRKRIIGNNN